MARRKWIVGITLVGLLVVLLVFAAPGLAHAATPNAPQSGTFTVNTIADNTTKDSVLTLREAVMLANGGTGANGLNRSLSDGEKSKLSGCIWGGSTNSWTISSGCGTGVPDTIVFSNSLGTAPFIDLTDLLILNYDSGTTIDGSVNNVGPTLDGSGMVGVQCNDRMGLVTVFSANATIKKVGAINNLCNGFGLNADGALIDGVWAWNNGFNGIYIGGDNNIVDNSLIGVPTATATGCSIGLYNYGNYDAGVKIYFNYQYGERPANNIVRNSYIGCNGFRDAFNTKYSGVLVGGDSTITGNTIGPNNYIGVNSSKSASLANALHGVELNDGSANKVYDNTIMDSNYDGVYVLSGFNAVSGNTIRNNAGNGITIDNGGAGSGGNYIGGPFLPSIPNGGNIIGGNHGNGLEIFAVGSNRLAGNIIGVTSNLLAADPNDKNGILLWGGTSGNSIGANGWTANVIGGNLQNGILLTGTVHSNTIINNDIGTNGLTDVGNQWNGIDLENGAYQNTIGSYPGGNYINFNHSFGVRIQGTSTMSNTVQNNSLHANHFAGLSLYGGAHDNTIGGVGGLSNSINNNLTSGITILGGAHDNRIDVNYVQSNTGYGIYLSGSGGVVSDNVISGTVISNSQLDGIYTSATTQNNRWTHLSTYNNGGLGINDNSGSTNTPTILNVQMVGSNVTINGTATPSLVGMPVVVEVYRAAPDPTGFGEGQTWLGTASVNNYGIWSFTTPLTGATCFTAFQTRTLNLISNTVASSEYSHNVCFTPRYLYLPLIKR